MPGVESPSNLNSPKSKPSPQDDYTAELLHSSSKPCRTCVDFKTWMKQGNKDGKTITKQSTTSEIPLGHDCPLDKDELGRNTWSFLHTMAAYYPERPSNNEQSEMKSFISSFARFYPCDYCASDFRKSIKKEPPEIDSQYKLSQWWCRMHNLVNKKLGKPVFDCSKVDERWIDGWKDGSCG